MLRVYYTNRNDRHKTCAPYRYLITNNATSYKAFVNIHAFKNWLRERSLKLVKCGKQGAMIEGEYLTRYIDHSLLTPQKDDINTMRMHNGEYVPCVIRKEDGHIVENVHHKGYRSVNDERQSIEEYNKLSKIYG